MFCNREKGGNAMPRRRREKCENSIYHIMVRGNNQQAIFLDDYDRNQYLKRLKRYKEKFKIEVYAYCLMTNHVHLLIYDSGQDISKVMQGLNLSYTIYFNKRHARSGHLFQDRFKSIMVKQDNYFIQVSKYIHRNPVEANMVQEIQDYKWSSYNIYMGAYDSWKIISTNAVLTYFSESYSKGIKLYGDYIEDTKVEEEIAVAIESGYTGLSYREELPKMNKDKVLGYLIDYFNIPKLNLLRRNNRKYGRQRDISIYIVALKTRLGYKILSELFYIGPAAIGASIGRAIRLMTEDNTLYEEVNQVLKIISE